MTIDSENATFGIAVDPEFGFRHLDPVPTAEFIDEYYSKHYMDLVSAGGRAPEVRRLLGGGAERESELAWLRSSFYADVEHALTQAIGGDRGRLIDLGAGTGDFLAYAIEQGWHGKGIEPSELAAARAVERGLDVTGITLEKYLDEHPHEEEAFDAMAMLNVLEHVPDPKRFLLDARRLLAPNASLCLSVPNDFTDLQSATLNALELRQWWVAVPDHINYFSYSSLFRTLEGCGFEVVERTGTFPIELLLLLGMNYVADPALGPEAHRRRVAFEAALPPEVRRRLYVAFAEAGFGRNCVVTARRLG